MTWLAYSHLGVAKTVQLTTQPAVAQAGIPFGVQPVGRLVDGSGVLSRATGVTVTASKASGTGTLSGTLSVQTVEGVFTFTDLKMDTVTSAVTLQFSATGMAVISNAFNVTQPNTTIGAGSGSYAVTGTAAALSRTRVCACTPGSYAITGTVANLNYSGVATSLAVTTHPAGAVSGVAFTTQPVVQLRNASSNNAAEAGVTVTAYLSSGSGTLGGTKTAVTNSSGVATFTNLSITGSGSHTVSFYALMSAVQTVWSDDAETNKAASYFEVNTNGGNFARASVNGSTQWRAICSGAGPEYGNLKLGIGRTPSGVASVGPSGVDFGLVTMECDITHSVNNLVNSQDKCLRMSVFSAGDWSQAAAVHIWSEGHTYLEIDPVTSVVNNAVTAVGWNDFAHFTWTGLTAGSNTLFGATATTQRHLKVVWRLNDPGQANGYIQTYIDGVLDNQQTGLNLVQAYTSYGINAVHWENYRTGGVTTANNRMYDNLAVSGQARATVAANAVSVSATTAAVLTGSASSGWYESEVVTGGQTIIITLTDDTWVAAGSTFDAQRQNIINNIVAATSPTNGWNGVRSGIPVTAVVRTSSTVVTITLPALASYAVTSNQTLTVTVPATAVVLGNAIVATPTLTIIEGAPTADPTPEPTPLGTIFYDARAGGANSWQAVGNLSQLVATFNVGGGSGLIDVQSVGSFAFTSDYDGAGKNALRFDWPANSGESELDLLYYYPATYQNVYTSFIQHLGKTATGGGLGTNGSFRPVTSAGGMKRFMWLRAPNNGTDRMYWVWQTQPEGQNLNSITCDNLNLDIFFNADMTPGVDVRWTFELIAGVNSITRVWRDGVLVCEDLSSGMGTLGFAQSNIPTTRFATQQAESEYITDLVMWTI